MIVKNFIHILSILISLLLFSTLVFGIPYSVTALFTNNDQIRLGVMFFIGYTFEFILLISVLASIEWNVKRSDTMSQFKLSYINQTLYFYKILLLRKNVSDVYGYVKSVVERLPKSIVKELAND